MKLAKRIIAEELEEFEIHFREAVKSRVALLDRIMQYIVKRKGKQLRPMFVLLSAKLGGPINDTSYRAASLVELLHTATLVHDDVVDEAMERRGFFSINALWKNKIAVLVGDYLLSKGLLLSLNNKDHLVLQILSNAVKEMSEGELLQIEKSRNLNLKEEVYYEIIKGKTASLLASSCAAGASSTFESEAAIDQMRLFGEKVGMAFQIKDDLFDYGSDDIGKPTGIDIKEKKMTLPLIFALQKSSFFEKRRIINIVKNNNNNPEKVTEVIEFVLKSGGIEYAESKMHQLKEEALTLLKTFPTSPSRESLEQLVLYTVNRKK